MLEEINSFFDSAESNEELKLVKDSDVSEGGLTDDFGSLFGDIIGESFIDMSENVDSLTLLDSNDGDITEYLGGVKPARRAKKHTESDPKLPSKSSRHLRSSHDVENLGDGNFDNTPRIDIYKLEETGKCTNRNALNARINRMRKKQYISDLEAQVDTLSKDNTDMKEKLISQTKKLTEAQKEVEYLRSVISNQSGLMSLLGNISNTAGVKLNASLVFANSDHENNNKVMTCNEGQSISCKRPCEITENSDSVSVKKTRNGLYLVNEKEEKVPTSIMSQNVPNVLKETNNNNGIKIDQSPDVLPSSLGKFQPTSGGVCLHVSNDNVSIELCSHCASSAKNSWEITGDHAYFKHDCDFIDVTD